jgi:hypothetical protein
MLRRVVKYHDELSIQVYHAHTSGIAIFVQLYDTLLPGRPICARLVVAK